MVTYGHARNQKVVVWITRYNDGSANYVGVTNMATAFNTILTTWNADGILVDHANASGDVATYDLNWSSAAFTLLSSYMASTNVTANNFNAQQRRRSFYVYGLSDYAFWHWVNGYDVCDLFLNANAPAGFTNRNGVGSFNGTNASAQAETNYVNCVNGLKNIATVKLMPCQFEANTPAFDTTNSFNLIMLEAYSVWLKGVGDDNTNLWTGMPIVQALENAELVSILKDPLVYRGISVTNFPNSDGSTMEVWVKKLSQPYKYFICAWNHSLTLNATNTVSLTALASELSGTVVVHDPWINSNLQTNTSGYISITNSPLQIIGLVLNGKSLTPVVNQGTTNASVLTSFTAVFTTPFADTNYTATESGNGFAVASSYVSSKTTTNCVFNMTAATGLIDWIAIHP
jgi:hypothetical protein